VSIKNKLVTAVTTAGLLAGLFGSAFVPSVRAAVGDLITVAAGKTNTAGTEAADIKALTGTKVVVDFGKDKTSIPATLTSAANTDDFAFTLSGPCYFGAVAADADASATLYASIATPTSKTLSAVTYDNVTSPKTLELNIEVYSSGAGSCTVVASENGVASGDIVIAFSSNPGVFVATASNWDDATYWQAVTNAYLTVDVDTAVFAALATNDVAVLTVSGAEIISVTESGTTATRTGSVLRYKNAAAATDVDPTLILKMPASAGTVTLTLENQTAEWSMSRSITVIGAALADVPSATYSTVVHSKTASTTTDDTSPVPANGATTLSATVRQRQCARHSSCDYGNGVGRSRSCDYGYRDGISGYIHDDRHSIRNFCIGSCEVQAVLDESGYRYSNGESWHEHACYQDYYLCRISGDDHLGHCKECSHYERRCHWQNYS